uniref:Retropepsins domain-containing protein n=1 Tax=Heliothis virescens TaxID=7102 RepID=A0A2A4K8X8_HELVI
MPPKKKIARDDTQGSDSDTDETMVASTPNVTMTEEMLHSLVSNITRSQAEANRILIESIIAGNQQHTSSLRSETPSQMSTRPGNFTKCSARFDGKSKSADELEAFIDAIQVFRECANISCEHALRGLPMLLVGEAAVWWQGVKSSVTSWDDALARLRGMFGVPRPAYKIFRDVFAKEQCDERCDVFISKVRALLSKLPYGVPEEMSVDIVYGLLSRKIRKRVPRDSVDGLDKLITKARLVEESLAEVSAINNKDNPSAAHGRAGKTSSINPRVPNVNSSDTNSEGQKRLGVVRSKCDKCKPAVNSSKSDFCSAHDTDSDDTRPIIEIEVVSRKGVAILDTGATHSMAGQMLYDLMVDAGVKFNRSARNLTLADGSHRVCEILECQVTVTLHNREILTNFMVLPDEHTRTLLGRDFINSAGLLLDLPQCSWRFNDEPLKWYPFITSFTLPSSEKMELMKVDAAGLVLRDDEGTRLTPPQRSQLNAFLLRRADRFAEEGPPTDFATHRLKVDFPSRSPKDARENQLKDPELRKIVEDLESADDPFRGRTDVVADMRAIVESDNVVTSLTPYLQRMSSVLHDARDVHERVQAQQKRCADQGRRPAPEYGPGDLVLLKTQGSNDATPGQTPKFIPRRDGPYRIKEAASSTTYVLERLSDGQTLGRYHVSQLTPFIGDIAPAPVNEKRKREGEGVARDFLNVEYPRAPVVRTPSAASASRATERIRGAPMTRDSLQSATGRDARAHVFIIVCL